MQNSGLLTKTFYCVTNPGIRVQQSVSSQAFHVILMLFNFGNHSARKSLFAIMKQVLLMKEINCCLIQCCAVVCSKFLMQHYA